jgi:hypothetical protein
MKTVISKLVFISALVFIFSCNKNSDMNSQPVNSQTGTGSISSSSINLSSFNEIEITNYCDVEIDTGATNKVDYSDYGNLVQYLKFEIVGNRLVVKTFPENTLITNSKAKAKIYVAGNLKGLFISGSGNMTLANSFNGISQCTVSGSGNLMANENSTSTNMAATISGSGSIDILKITSQSANCTVSGSGNISVAVTNDLTANISGSGSISYLGNPTVSKSITGSGNVTEL